MAWAMEEWTHRCEHPVGLGAEGAAVSESYLIPAEKAGAAEGVLR